MLMELLLLNLSMAYITLSQQAHCAERQVLIHSLGSQRTVCIFLCVHCGK